MECKLGYGFGVGSCIQWLQVVEILLVCAYSPTLSFLFKRLIVSTMHLFTDFIYQATVLFSPSTLPQSTALLALQLHSAGLPFSPFPHITHLSPPVLHDSTYPSVHSPYANTLQPSPRISGATHPYSRPTCQGHCESPPYLSPPLPLHVILNQAELRMSPGRNALIRSCWSNLCSWA